MLLGIKGYIYPNQHQVQQIHQNIGNSRFVWNQMLNMMNTRYQNNPNLKSLGKFDLDIFLPCMKLEFPFLKDGESSSLQHTNEKLIDAFHQFFRGKRKHPKFKAKKRVKASFTMKNNKNMEITHNAIKLPKIGWVKFNYDNSIQINEIKRVTVTHTPSKRYEVSVLVESEKQVLDKTGKKVGLDMGQIDLMIGSDGLRIPTKIYKHYEQQLISWQKKMSRRMLLAKRRGIKLDDAKNYQKAKCMVARYHAKIRQCRLDYLHKVTKMIVTKYDFIAIEDLKVKNMMSNSGKKKQKANHRKIANQSWGILAELLIYKSEMYGKKVVKVDPKYTSQICSSCGTNTGKKHLSIRQWTCICGVIHDRDINAAINILNKALSA